MKNEYCKSKLFECSCDSMHHIVKFYYMIDDQEKEWEDWLYLDVSVDPFMNLWKRIVAAFKLIFKIDAYCIFEHMMPTDKIGELVIFLQQAEKDILKSQRKVGIKKDK